MKDDKEQLREEFDRHVHFVKSAVTYSLAEKRIDAAFDWFYSKIEAKDKEIEKANELHQLYFDKFNEAFTVGAAHQKESMYWQKACDSWALIHKNSAHEIERLTALLSAAEEENKLLKEVRYRADSVLYEDSGHKELGDALRNWDAHESEIEERTNNIFRKPPNFTLARNGMRLARLS